MREMFYRRYFNNSIAKEMSIEYENYQRVSDMKYAKNIPVYIILDYDSCNELSSS